MARKSKRGKIIILVAPSGAGKTTLARRLMDEFPDIRFSVSATTRPPRPHEVHGKDYFFLSPKQFQQAIDRGQFLEWEEFYGGKRYGSLISEVEKELEKGYFVLFDIEVKGALNVKSHYGDDALAIFIRPPSDAVLVERLKTRGTENDESLQLRLERARMELSYADRFDHVIVNDDLDRCYDELRGLVTSFMNHTHTH
ncbi:MAG: guanylate kinase [Cyclonatronaceae bacterium]